MKIVKAIPPYLYIGASNFKYYPCEAWEKIGVRFQETSILLSFFIA